MSETITTLTADDVEWVVNDNSELGVKIGEQFFWLYKGDSLVYEDGHDDGAPIKWRKVFKREFGECCHPWGSIKHQSGKEFLPDQFIGFFGEPEDEWKELPCKKKQ